MAGLVDQARAAGLDVSLTEEGERRAVPPGVDLAAFRIVQEALTNARNMLRETAAQVCVRYSNSGVEVDVANAPGPGGNGARPARGSGHGLVGVRERVRVYGRHARHRPAARRRLSRPRSTPAGTGAMIGMLLPHDTSTIKSQIAGQR